METDEKIHIDSDDCWCHPEMVLEGVEGKFGSVTVHHGNGEELAPAWIIAEAIADAFKAGG